MGALHAVGGRGHRRRQR
ncbi:hypothetical protein [Streptomyces sp. NPDC048155]